MAGDESRCGYKYEVHVYTGFRTRAQTSSKVHIKIAGSSGTSDVIILNEGDEKVMP